MINRTTKSLVVCLVGSIALVLPALADPINAKLETNEVRTVADTGISNRERWQRMKYGFFVHYVWDGGQGATPIRADGTKPASMDELADGFDAKGFARDLSAMGVEYVFFTAWHSGNFPLYPSAVADRVSGRHRSPKRDLLGDMIDACHAAGIRVLFYTHPEQAIDWNRDWFTDQADEYAELIGRYGSRIDGLFLDENNPAGLMDPSRNRFQNLERIIRRWHPDLVLVQNYFGNLYATDGAMWEWGGQPGAGPLNWGAASASPIAHTIASGWIAQKPPGERTMLYTGEGIFRFTVMMAGSCTEGGGVAWASGPYVGGGWETGVMEEMTKAGGYIAPIAESIKNTYPSRSYITPGGIRIGELTWGVATRSPDGQTEYLHVLKPPKDQTLKLPPPADGKVFTHARLLPSQRPVKLVQTQDGLELTLPPTASWDRLDTVIAMDVLCPGGRALINDSDPSIVCRGSSWQHLRDRNRGEYGNDVHAATADGDNYAITFEGTDIQILSSLGPDRGVVDFFLNGTLCQSVNMAAGTNSRAVVFEASGLPNGRHQLKAVKRGGALMAIDAYQVSELLNDNDPRIVYSPKDPDWGRTEIAGLGCVGDDVHATRTLANLIQLDFEGSDLDVLAPLSEKLGTVHYLINGKVAKIGTQYGGVASRSQVVFSCRDYASLAPGKNTLRMHLNRGEEMRLDAIRIYKRPISPNQR